MHHINMHIHATQRGVDPWKRSPWETPLPPAPWEKMGYSGFRSNKDRYADRIDEYEAAILCARSVDAIAYVYPSMHLYAYTCLYPVTSVPIYLRHSQRGLVSFRRWIDQYAPSGPYHGRGYWKVTGDSHVWTIWEGDWYIRSLIVLESAAFVFASLYRLLSSSSVSEGLFLKMNYMHI